MNTLTTKEDGSSAEKQKGDNYIAEAACLIAPPQNLESIIPKNDKKPKTKKTISRPSKKKHENNMNRNRSKKPVTSSSDDFDSSDSDLLESSSSSDSSEAETKKRNGKKKYLSRRKLKEKKKIEKKKLKNRETSDKDKDSDEDSDQDSKATSDVNNDADLINLQKEFLRLQILSQKQRLRMTQESNPWGLGGATNIPSADTSQLTTLLCNPVASKKKPKELGEKKRKYGYKLDYKKIDNWWDKKTYRYKTTESDLRDDYSKFDQYSFNVRRKFGFNGHLEEIWVDIKNKYLKEVLSTIMKEAKFISFAQQAPKIHPNILFLFLEDIRKYYKKLKSLKHGGKNSRKETVKNVDQKMKHLKVLIKYLNHDFARASKALRPMRSSGYITYEYLWALYKPGSIVCSPTHGNHEAFRAFKVTKYEKIACLRQGFFYSIDGKYIDYDGKTWGMSDINVKVPLFSEASKISSLNCFPLKYHENAEKLRNELIERGKKFVSLHGVHYKVYEGIGYFQKKKKETVKVSINGRIMIDPTLHRKYCPNYPISDVQPERPANQLLLSDSDSDKDDEESGGESNNNEKCNDSDNCSYEELDLHESSENDENDEDDKNLDENETVLKKIDASKTESSKIQKFEEIPCTASYGASGLNGKSEVPKFSDEDYIIMSSVVLGFCLTEKFWFEFLVSGIKEIVWNEGAYDSLVLEENTKTILKALVESHKSHPGKNIDDVIRGKGRGLVAVLHGPPGTGKTLTAEGIAELLKYPLYTVSAGEIGHEPTRLERQLNMILKIAHAWGAVLLLDEADVFLEKRNTHDIHRNALVSIFQRLLEYFQGILFLTTNRVETFDEAFQSRIHVALRYGELNSKARQSVFKVFLDRVSALENVKMVPFTAEDLNELSKHTLNGRQIKNTIRTALALAVQSNEALSISHVQKVLQMSKAFERHLHGGPGFEDAMRGYF